MNTIIAAALSGGFATAVVIGIVQIVKSWLQRPVTHATAASTQADAAVKLNDSALKLIEAAQKDAADASKDAAEARREAAEARRETTEARREATEARRSAEDTARDVRMLKAAIMSPLATIESLRQMVGEPGSNGIHRIPYDTR